MKTVFFVDDYGVALGIPQEMHGVPFIIDENGKPAREINEYLLARRNGDWDENVRRSGYAPEMLGRTAHRAQLNYLRNRAYHLNIFRKWLRDIGKPFSQIQGSDLDNFINHFSNKDRSSAKLRNSTLNQYLTSIIDFLKYSSYVNLRPPLEITLTKSTAKHGGKPLAMRRPDPSSLEIWYTDRQINFLIECFNTSTMQLIAKIIYSTGLRLKEALNLRVSNFDFSNWSNSINGGRLIGITGKYGKHRLVPFDVTTLQAIEKFINFERKVYARKLKTKTDSLLLGPIGVDNAAPLTDRAVQKAFCQARQVASLSHLSPHLLRHHYAAHYLLRAWRLRSGLSQTPCVDFTLASSLLSAEIITLQQVLGHAHIETTLKYLYAIGYLMAGDIAASYSDAIDPPVSP